ncbi:MFS transporter [Burkholderia multivorans]|uniref:MFS transporter n=1 Tax=Burkholderia multivorans TaxID=87883 RepID=UPI002018E925|nr:MFS transporter [Burkholderia multivorans]MCO1360463.1 MFS transporter [Burkholderia multivorans]UQO95780.1 MFS transporter [Burkholderia multivorans]
MSSSAGKYADAGLALVPRPQIDAVYAKVTRRLVPFLFVCYLFSFIDRSNVGFAQLQMKSSLGFSDAAYGIGATMFFVGYALFEVPSNLLLQRIGARATLFRIMVLWGAASAATMFVRTPTQFYLLRFLLGVFEAGFFPGIVLYLTYWFPSNRRARVIALILMASVAAGFVTGPISGVILKSLHEAGGLEGWQWMFVLEGLPTMIAAGFVFVLLPDRPEHAAWLDDAEKARIREALEETDEPLESRSLLRVLSDPRAYLLAFGIFVNGCTGYFLAFWVPTLIRELGVADPRAIGLYTVIPNAFGIVAMILYGRHSDLRNEQRMHWALAFVVAAIGFVALGRTVQHSLPRVLGADADPRTRRRRSARDRPVHGDSERVRDRRDDSLRPPFGSSQRAADALGACVRRRRDRLRRARPHGAAQPAVDDRRARVRRRRTGVVDADLLGDGDPLLSERPRGGRHRVRQFAREPVGREPGARRSREGAHRQPRARDRRDGRDARGRGARGRLRNAQCAARGRTRPARPMSTHDAAAGPAVV